MQPAQVLAILLLCGLMGLLGQGIRAVVGLKTATSSQGVPTQQSEFNAAYLLFSLMIGFLAGILAGLAMGLSNFQTIDLDNLKILFGVATAGYAGTDFIENTFSIIFPSPSKATAAKPDVVADANIQALGAHVSTLNASVSSLTNALGTISGGPSARVAPPAVGVPGLAIALNAASPHVDTNVWVPPLTAAFSKFDMLSNKRMAAAIGQFLVEAGAAFQELVEDLWYSHASRLVEVFPREFPTEADAQPYVNNPEALGNRVYANRLGNGNEASGDGYRFRGRGLIQLTGRSEYTQFGTAIGMTAEQASQYCETPAGAAMSGCWYLSSRGCLPFADSWDLSEITRRVNGAAMLGNAQRIAYSDAVLNSLGGLVAAA
jgi:predicted chitinase